MTATQVKSLNLGFDTVDDTTVLVVETALEWVLNNTTLEFDIDSDDLADNIPSSVKLFIKKFAEMQTTTAGISSESIEGLSQSYDTSDKTEAIWNMAETLLYPYLKSRVRFVCTENRWRRKSGKIHR